MNEEQPVSGLVPEPPVLLSKETSAGLYTLLDMIRNADTAIELLAYMERLIVAEREYRDIFNLLEREAVKRLREFQRYGLEAR